MIRTTHLATVSLVGVGLFIASVGLVHVVQPNLNPVDVAVSYYMNGRLGWVLGAGLVALGIGSLSLATALGRLRATRESRVGLWLLVVWGVGAMVAGVFRPDPYGHWNEPPSVSGSIHGVVALVAFLAFVPAAGVLSRQIRSLAGITAAARVLQWLAMLCAVALAAFFACLAPVFQNRAPYALGLVERLLLVAFIAWIAASTMVIRSREEQHERKTVSPRIRNGGASKKTKCSTGTSTRETSNPRPEGRTHDLQGIRA